MLEQALIGILADRPENSSGAYQCCCVERSDTQQHRVTSPISVPQAQPGEFPGGVPATTNTQSLRNL